MKDDEADLVCRKIGIRKASLVRVIRWATEEKKETLAIFTRRARALEEAMNLMSDAERVVRREVPKMPPELTKEKLATLQGRTEVYGGLELAVLMTDIARLRAKLKSERDGILKLPADLKLLADTSDAQLAAYWIWRTLKENRVRGLLHQGALLFHLLGYGQFAPTGTDRDDDTAINSWYGQVLRGREVYEKKLASINEEELKSLEKAEMYMK